MSEEIVQSSHPITLIGAGDVEDRDLRAALALAPMLVAADGGAGLALSAGHVPDAVIGDLDSLQPADRARLTPGSVHKINDQDTTDFDKVLERTRAPLLLAVGFLGARVDHQLAAFSSLMRFRHRACILIGGEEVIFHAPPALSVDVPPGAVVSLFPLTRVTGRSEGLRWPIDGLVLEPGARIGTSNHALGPIQLEFDTPGMLVILPRAALAAVTQALGDPQPSHGAHWPAPA